ncbi:MAG: aminotransferase class V-fold PLP-dependent enzyme [Pyrinomonadaceae bacterium]
MVQEAMRRYLEFSNHAPTYTMWRILEPQIEAVRKRLAAAFGCDPEEMAITRNASEALEICQLGLDLKPGDEVLTTEQDYPRMLTTWRQRERRDRIVVKKIQFPTPPESLDQLALLFEQAITPRTRVIHFCHITNMTGQIFPVKRICQMARARGIEAIVDGAHAFAHFPFKHADLDCDYYGTSLHKWLLAPHGTGFLYVRRNKIKKLVAVDGGGGKVTMLTSASLKRSVRTRRPIIWRLPKRSLSTKASAPSARPRVCATCFIAGRSGWRERKA